jgi:hypothetical protein
MGLRSWDKEAAVRTLTEGDSVQAEGMAAKEAVFCYRKAESVPASECVMPCMTFKLGRTTSQCRYFAEHWASVVSKNMNKVSPQ